MCTTVPTSPLRRALASTSQASRVNPNPAKNRALLAPYRCSGLSKYSVIFSRSTTANSVLGRRMGGAYHFAANDTDDLQLRASIPNFDHLRPEIPTNP